ncbi:MAG: hypothetical protein SFV21_01095 [Rhodospirillaceae bacterium]|nr:hypothetical protein [Rhodospirillaceae bacterium]
MNRRHAMVATAAMAAVAAVPGPSAAQQTPVSPTGSNVLRGADVPWVPMAEWEILSTARAEQSGARILIAAGDEEIARAPQDAVKYRAKTFAFPTGDIRILDFTQAAGGVLHQVTYETQIYVLQGSAEVGVAGVPTPIFAGDVVSLPSGVLRSQQGKAEDTVIIAYTVAPPKDGKSKLVRAADAPEATIRQGEKSGQGGTTVTVKRYVFDGNSIRVAALTKGGRTTEVKPDTDALIYLLSGRMGITIGPETTVVEAGDALREPAGLPTFWEVTENASFISTSAPFTPNPAN